MKDLRIAKTTLEERGYTCVLCKGETIYTSTQRGVKPLLERYEKKEDLTGFSAADKVVGKATAFLYVLLKVKAVYAKVVSRSALETLKAQGIFIEYDELVEYIVNRRGDGICPFEGAVLEISSPVVAYEEIVKKAKEIFGSND